MKGSDPFHVSEGEKKDAAGYVPASEDKNSIKFGLLPQKGNQSK